MFGLDTSTSIPSEVLAVCRTATEKRVVEIIKIENCQAHHSFAYECLCACVQ